MIIIRKVNKILTIKNGTTDLMKYKGPSLTDAIGGGNRVRVEKPQFFNHTFCKQ